ncbi:TnsA-like heteromeric transposase endonuclease subunit [Nonomuraea sp. NPDC052116]|uniref:TnsA-like heteromeric transposase endonuclease subunit n=1 Tax=Nonomuraea sp. NPDC052116 TaxID=3155665 RepID=UPI0034320395
MGNPLLAPEPLAARFGLRFLDEVDGRLRQRQTPLAIAWNTRFERVQPVRHFPSYRGQRNFSGYWWSSTMRDLVGFESWLERDQVMMLDFAPEVTAFSSQPFWLTWPEGGKTRRHAPDYFARLSDGTGVVIDVRADDQIEPKDAAAFAATEAACETVGWAYRRVGAVDPVLAANVRWLSDYKQPYCLNPDHDGPLRKAFAQAAPLLETVRSVGDPMAVLPSVFHLMWLQVLQADLARAPLSGSMFLAVGDGA